MSKADEKNRHLILLVEETASALGFYDSSDGAPVGRVQLSQWPHEVAVSPDGRTAYVSNFGLRDYDLTIGNAGNSVSVVDIASRCEVHRLYTCFEGETYWGPHGVRVSPDGNRLYVNVERVVGLRGPDPSAGPGMEQTKILVFDLETRKVVKSLAMALPQTGAEAVNVDDPVKEFGVPRGSHNFIFAPDSRSIWIFSGRGGLSRIDAESGAIMHHISTFNGAVRGLSRMANGHLLVSATNEIGIVDPATGAVLKQFGNLGVGQILYSESTPDGKYALAPAVWEGQVLIINLDSGKVTKRIPTGVDPVHIHVAPHGRSAYVTHGRSRWAAEISFDSFDILRRLPTLGGPNGVDTAPWSDVPEPKTLYVGSCLPFTGEFSIEGRELRLG